MDSVVEKKLSQLSRGFGTASGKLVRDTPVFSTDSLDENDLRKEKSSESLDDLFLLRIQGRNEKTIHKLNTFNDEAQREKGHKLAPHKTYSTKGGSLILFAENAYKVNKRKKRKHRKSKKPEFDNISFEGTCEDLAHSILKFGNGNFHLLKSQSHNLRDERLITVRPGYSPMRYVASVSKLWDPNWVEKLLNEKAIQERNLEKYKKIKLPKIDIIPSSNFDPLLRERPKPYSRISLPDIFFKRKEASNLSNNNKSVPDQSIVDNTSTGYARSYASDGNVLERKKRCRKKTMQLNKLELEIPETKLPGIEGIEEGESDSDSEWGGRKETARMVVERTFEDLLGDPSAGGFQQQTNDHENLYPRNLSAREDSTATGEKSSETSSISTLIKTAQKHNLLGYPSLDMNQKEELISHLLLEGIKNEATRVEQLINDEDDHDNANDTPRGKISDIDRISLPQSSLPDIQSQRGFKGNALHSNTKSTNSSLSKSSNDENLKSKVLIVASVNKLPPIKSEPGSADNNERLEAQHYAPLPPLTKKISSKPVQKSITESDGDLSTLIVDGRAIEVADVEVVVTDGNHSSSEDSESESDLIKILNQNQDALEMQQDAEDVSQGNLDARAGASNRQSPDSGRSTGTGLTTISDSNLPQLENKQQKEPMTPLVEESSRSSKASKLLSREGTVNSDPAGLKQNSFISQKSNVKEASVGEVKEDSTLGIRSLWSDENDESNGINAGAIVRYQTEEDKEPNDYNNADKPEDEGVVADHDDEVMEKGTDDENDELTHQKASTEEQEAAESIGITRSEADVTKDDKFILDDDRGSEISTSSTLLQVQAKAAAQSVLARPKSGLDLIEDMKIAATVFGKLFEENISREASKSSIGRHARTRSDLPLRSPRAKKGRTDQNRSLSDLSVKTKNKIGDVDLDQLKANVSNLEHLINKNVSKNHDEEGDITIGESNEVPPDQPGDVVGSDKSFPATSIKSENRGDKNIQMEILSYVNPEKEKTIEEIESKHPNVNNQEIPVKEKEATFDTDEEQFKIALKAIVDEVEDLKEKKISKPKKGRKAKPTQGDRFNIVRDSTPVSTPFYAGKPKESKAPKGLNRIKEEKKKSGEKISKNVSVKKGRGKLNKKGKLAKKPAELRREQKDNEKSNAEEKRVEKEIIDGDDNQSTDSKAGNELDKYDVPIIIKTAIESKETDSEVEADKKSAADASEEIMKTNDNVHEATNSLNESGVDTAAENDNEGSRSVSDKDSSFELTDIRTRNRRIAAENRRLKVEQRRKEREEAKRRALEEAEREEKLRQEAELEMQRRMQEYKKRQETQDEEKMRKEEEDKERMKRAERERERERREREELKRKKAAMAARLKLEEDMKRERERIAKEIEAELRRQEEQKLKEMEEHERIEYEKQKKLEEEERLKQEEEKKRLERERRLIEEEELKMKMKQLEEFHRMLLERAKFWEGMKNSRWFLEMNQRLTKAFTFSYFDLLPAMMFQFTDLRPFTPKGHDARKLPTIPEERKKK